MGTVDGREAAHVDGVAGSKWGRGHARRGRGWEGRAVEAEGSGGMVVVGHVRRVRPCGVACGVHGRGVMRMDLVERRGVSTGCRGGSGT
jgi:hypothetical protein